MSRVDAACTMIGTGTVFVKHELVISTEVHGDQPFRTGSQARQYRVSAA